ncbi:DUF1824 family protein [Cyanobium sp. Morenito 9A2]|nr:DUF1824 family protein [Cyanobium sp. Morenito 9A2]
MLCGLRSAPTLDAEARELLRTELDPRLAACEWFTIGVMAADSAAALAALRQLESALGWQPLQVDPSEAGEPRSGGVFLKGNQTSGRVRLRQESGLGVGLLITGHSSVNPDAEDTWGPFPLDFFA